MADGKGWIATFIWIYSPVNSCTYLKTITVVVLLKSTGNAPPLKINKFKVLAKATFQYVIDSLKKQLKYTANEPLVSRSLHWCNWNNTLTLPCNVTSVFVYQLHLSTTSRRSHFRFIQGWCLYAAARNSIVTKNFLLICSASILTESWWSIILPQLRLANVCQFIWSSTL